MKRSRYSEDEIILCTYIARFGRDLIDEELIRSLFDRRPVGSVKMKVQNIARMLSEEGYRYSQEVSPWGGGHRTDWQTVQYYADRAEPDFTALVKELLARGRQQSEPTRKRDHQQTSTHEPLDKTSEETRTLFHELEILVKSLGSVQTEEITTVRARRDFKSVIHFKCTAAPGATPSVVAYVHLLVRSGLDVHIHEKHLSAFPLEDGFTRPYHDGYRKIMIRDLEHIRMAEPLLRAAYDDLHKHGHGRAKGGEEALKPITPRRPGNSPSASAPPYRRTAPKQRRRRRMGDRDFLQLGENHEP